MAREVGLSRSRFYSLLEEGVFPQPVYLIRTRRPVYTPDLQEACLEARRRGLGAVSGQPVVFYQRSPGQKPLPKPSRRKSATAATMPPLVARLVEGLKQLGVADPKPSAISAAITEAYPDGVGEAESGAVLAAVYRRMRASQ
jgi:hypothetical protein